MKRILLIITLICLITLPIFGQTGNYTTNEYFYLPEYGAYGTTEYDEYNTYMEIADNQIEANKDNIASVDVSLYYLKTEIDTLGEVETIYNKNILDTTELNTFSELQILVADKTLVNVEDGIIATSITDDLIVEADLNVDESPADNDILTYDTTGANFSWQEPSELITAGNAIAWDSTTLNVTLRTEAEVKDWAGAMFSGNTETLITATYQTDDDTVDLVVNNDLHNYSWSNVVDGDVPDSITVTGYMEDTDIDSFTKLQSWVNDKTLVNEEDVFTIDANWVNTANPWADDEVEDGITINLATLATTLTITDNESTDENNAILFTSGGVESGDLNIESDGGNLSYNPSTGTFYTTTLNASAIYSGWASIQGELDMTGANAIIDLNPAQTGTVQVINITPDAILSTNEAMWEGIFIDGDALDPSGDDIGIYGVSIDFSGISPTGTGDHSDGYKVIMAGITEDALHIENGKIKIEGDIPSTPIATFTGIDFRYGVHVMDATSMLHAIDVAVTEGTPAGDIVAVGTHSHVDVIHQHIGTFTTPVQSGVNSFAGIYDNSETNYTAGIDEEEMFLAINDAIWLGDGSKFDELEVDMSSDAARTITPTFWYWKNLETDAWVEFEPADDTDGFQHSGLIRWMASDLTDWLIHDPASGEGAEGYWIKVVRTANADPGTPTAETIKTGAVTLYSWDKTGDLTVKDIDANDINAASLVLDTQLAIAEGGTNSGTSLNGSKVMVSSATAVVESANITTTELELLNGLGNTIVTDNNAVTELEGTGLSITTGTLNMTVPNEHIDSDMYVDGSIDNEHLSPDIISGLADVTSEDADYILIWDNTDSALKKVDIGEVRGAGGGTVDTSGTPVQYDYARFTDVDTIEGRSHAEMQGDITPITTSSTTNTLTTAEAGLILVSDAHTETLPTASGNVGLTYHFVKTDWDYDLITLEGDGAETFNYENTTSSPNLTYLRLNTPLAEVTIVSDGSNWQVINEAMGQIPEVRAYLTANQENLTNDTWTTITLNSETYDIGNNFDTGAYKFVAPVSGMYAMYGYLLWVHGSVVADKRYYCRFYNGEVAIGNDLRQSSIAEAFVNFIVTIYPLSKDDEIFFKANQVSGGNSVDIEGGSPYTFAIIRLISKD